MKNTILLIGLFLIAVSACTNQSRLEMTQTDEPVSLEADADAFFITVDSSGEIWIDDQVIDPLALRSRLDKLREDNPDLPIVVYADQSSPTRSIIGVLDAASSSSMENVSIVALE